MAIADCRLTGIADFRTADWDFRLSIGIADCGLPIGIADCRLGLGLATSISSANRQSPIQSSIANPIANPQSTM
jgi:hypothetical protein